MKQSPDLDTPMEETETVFSKISGAVQNFVSGAVQKLSYSNVLQCVYKFCFLVFQSRVSLNDTFRRSVEDENNNPSPLSEADERFHQMSDIEKCELETPPAQEMDCSEPCMKPEISDASDGEPGWTLVSENKKNVNSPSNTNRTANEEAAKNRLNNEKSEISYRSFDSTRSANKSQVISSAKFNSYTQQYGTKQKQKYQHDAGPWK